MLQCLDSAQQSRADLLQRIIAAIQPIQQRNLKEPIAALGMQCHSSTGTLSMQAVRRAVPDCVYKSFRDILTSGCGVHQLAAARQDVQGRFEHGPDMNRLTAASLCSLRHFSAAQYLYQNVVVGLETAVSSDDTYQRSGACLGCG